jgi:hypothetical protein
MSVQRRLFLPRSEADIERHVAPSGQQTAQHQRTRQAGIDSSEPSAPSRDRSRRREFDATDRMTVSSPTSLRNDLDDLRYRQTPHQLRPSSNDECSQEEDDVDRVEAGSLGCRGSLLTNIVS